MSGNIPQWQPGTTYVPGALVVPRSSAPPAFVDLINKTLTATTGWDLASPLQILADGAGYGGQGRIACQGNSTGALALNQAHMPVVPGQTVSASCMCAHGTSNDHASDASVQIHWYNASNVEITPAAAGTGVPSLSNAGWQQISVSGTAPGGTAYARVGVAMNLSDFSTDTIQCSGFQVNYTVQVSPQATMYEATQATPGKSGSTEPTWPPEGSSVVDNQVTWNGVNIARLVWQASPLLTSGTTEPTWPTVAGGAVNDNGIDWICQIPNVKDTNCPNTPQVIILSSKVFAANNDITSFCATNNPLDWSTAQDAGFLPTGFQSVGETFATALGQYRGMLAVWTGSALELWQTDPDPAQMGLTDTFEGGGTSYYRAQASVSGDLFYLSPRGVRAVSVTAGSGNMEASTSAGLPVDTLVLPAIQGIQPLGIYYPGLGQYWLICGTEAFILTVDDAEGPSWSRYTFPTAITGATVLNGLLYLRDASNLYVLDEDTYQDNGQNIPVTVQWPWQDLDSPGVLKQLIGFDIVHSENVPMFATLAAAITSYATFDPTRNSNGTLSSRNTVVTEANSASSGTAVNVNKTTGKWYVEFTTLASAFSNSESCQVTSKNASNPISYNAGGSRGTLEWQSDGGYYDGAVYKTGAPAWNAVGSVIGVAFDATARQIWIRSASGWAFGADPTKASPFATLPDNGVGVTVGIAFSYTAGYTPSVQMNTGTKSFSYAIPSGFSALSGPPFIVGVNGSFYANLCNLSLAQSIQSATVTGVTVYGYGNTSGTPNIPGFTTTYDDNCSPQISAALSPAQTANPTDWTIAPNPTYPNFTLQANYSDLFVQSWNLVKVTIQVTATDGTVYTCNVEFTELVP